MTRSSENKKPMSQVFKRNQRRIRVLLETDLAKGLKPLERQVLVMYYLKACGSTPYIARQMGVPIKRIRSAWLAGMKKLGLVGGKHKPIHRTTEFRLNGSRQQLTTKQKDLLDAGNVLKGLVEAVVLGILDKEERSEMPSWNDVHFLVQAWNKVRSNEDDEDSHGKRR